MELSRVAPSLRPALRRSPRLPLNRAWARGLVRVVVPRMRPAHTPGVTLTLLTDGASSLRVHTPQERRSAGALLWIHGGGFVIGGAVQDDALCGLTARELGIVVVSVEYGLAPEHPFPTPLDDAHAGWTWVQDNARSLGVDPARVVVGGQSAGGGLAACLVQRLHDQEGPDPVAQWLFCPMLDDRTAARRDLDAVRHRVWDNRLNRFGWRAYLDAEPGAPTLPPYAVAARRADLRGLPPAWIGVGDIDLFRDEDLAYADRLTSAGVGATVRTVPGAPHGFESWASTTALAREHLAAARAWLADVVRAGP